MRISKWLFGVCLAVLVVFGTGMRADAALLDASGAFEYNKNGDGTVSIADYIGTDETVVIPSEIDGMPVTSIGDFAFYNCGSLKSVTIPEGVTSIGISAFDDCCSLSNISIPDSVTSIGIHAFYECSGLTDISIPDGVTSIGRAAFTGCSSLKDINVPDGVARIEDNTFYGCGSLAGISIPESVTHIGEYAFYNCSSLKGISIPEGVARIEKETFNGCSKLNSVNLPNGLVSIGDYAFYDCSELNHVDLPHGLASIGECVFAFCNSIEKLVIPDSVTYIGEEAFLLSYVDRIPIYGNPHSYIKTYCDADRNIKFSCINHARIVADAEVAATCWSSGQTAGSHCADCGTVLSGCKRIPPGHSYAWVIIKEPTVRSVGRKEYRCAGCGDVTRLEIIPKLSVPKKGEVIPDSQNNSYKVTKPGKATGTAEFHASKSQSENVSVPSVVKISGVTYKVTSISKNAFKNNKNLKEITIKGDITKIGANAFRGCKNLRLIIIKSKKLKSVGKDAFKGIHPKAKIRVPSNKLSKYKKIIAKKGQKSTVKITK